MNRDIKIPQGSREYLYVDLRTDRVLDTQAISIAVSDDRLADEWETAEWVGEPGTFRSARILLDGSLTKGRYQIFARITDLPEAPIVYCGRLEIT